MFNLKVAVKDALAVQDFDLESLAAVGKHSQIGKAPTGASDSNSKDCADRGSLTAIFRFTVLCLVILPLQLVALDLKEEVKKAESGDFIVYQYKQSLVLLRIREQATPLLVVEEISAPATAATANWQEWLSKKAPGHTSWTISRINISSGRVESIFSVDDKAFLNSNPAFQFLPTLLQLTLKPIEPHDRKYIGAEPLAGEKDMRHLWFPKIIFEGKQLSIPIEVYRVTWPDDDSELASKPIDVYFVQKSALTYLPYWIEVAGFIQKAKISALDSGKKLTSPIVLHSYEQEDLDFHNDEKPLERVQPSPS